MRGEGISVTLLSIFIFFIIFSIIIIDYDKKQWDNK